MNRRALLVWTLAAGAGGLLIGLQAEGWIVPPIFGFAMGAVTGLCLYVSVLSWPNLDAGPSD